MQALLTNPSSPSHAEVLQRAVKLVAAGHIVALSLAPDEAAEAFHPPRPAIFSKRQGGTGMRSGTGRRRRQAADNDDDDARRDHKSRGRSA